MNYSNNIKILKYNYPYIYNSVIKLSSSEEIYEIIPTKNEQVTLKVNHEGKSIYLHSRYNPHREALNIAEENYDSKTQNYIIFGLGFGYHVQEIMSMAPDSNFYIIEPNEYVFRLALDNVDLSSIISSNRVKLFVSDDLSEMSEVLNEFILLDNTKIVIHKPSIDIMSDKFVKLKYLLEEFKIKENSIKNHVLTLEKNFESNVKNYNGNVDILFNQFIDLPLYVISAGPSLDKNIKELANAKDKGIILSVGRAVRPLIDADIEPDLIVITDPSPYLYDMQLKGLDIKVPIIVLSTCDKNVMLNYGGHKLIALQNGYEPAEEYAKENNNKLVETGGSVATTALDIAINMGCNPIIFVGQDLAFTDNKTHAEATFSKDITLVHNLRKVEDINGDIVYTQKNLYSYLRWIQNRISVEKDITFIDATEGGAIIKGTQILTLRKAIENYSKGDITGKMQYLKQLR